VGIARYGKALLDRPVHVGGTALMTQDRARISTRWLATSDAAREIEGSLHFSAAQPLPDAVLDDLIRTRLAELEAGRT
jgi:hypothetical protein